ncbi:hypothetical protein BXZ70DRAFT_901237, partial [Cristinia sonorae]
LATRTYLLASNFAEASQRLRREQAQEPDVASMVELLSELRIRLEDTFTFMSEHCANIRAIGSDTAFDPKRTSYKNMHVAHVLRTEQQKYKLTNVFNIAARVKLLTRLVKRTCSSVRNAFRLDLVNGVTKNPESLTATTFRLAMKYKMGGAGEQLDPIYTLHIAILVSSVFLFSVLAPLIA